MNTLLTSAAAGLLAAASFAPASAATFTDSGSFGAATSNVSIETFDVAIPGRGIFDASKTITFANGTTSTAKNNQQFNTVNNGSFFGGTRAGRPDANDNTITFDFGRNVTAFGGMFTGAAEIMVSAFIDGANQTFLLGDSLTGSDGFFGLTSTSGFKTVTFSTDAGGFLPFGTPTVSLQAKNFRLDDLALGDAAIVAPAPVPLPASALLLVGAFGGFGALRRFRKAA